jgi:hypothetical protein
VSVNILTIFYELLANLISYRTDAVTKISKHVEAPDAMMLEPCVVLAAAHVRAARRVVRAAACLEQQAILVVHQGGAEQALLAAKRRRNAVQLEAYAVRELV